MKTSKRLKHTLSELSVKCLRFSFRFWATEYEYQFSFPFLGNRVRTPITDYKLSFEHGCISNLGRLPCSVCRNQIKQKKKTKHGWHLIDLDCIRARFEYYTYYLVLFSCWGPWKTQGGGGWRRLIRCDWKRQEAGWPRSQVPPHLYEKKGTWERLYCLFSGNENWETEWSEEIAKHAEYIDLPRKARDENRFHFFDNYCIYTTFPGLLEDYTLWNSCRQTIKKTNKQTKNHNHVKPCHRTIFFTTIQT